MTKGLRIKEAIYLNNGLKAFQEICSGHNKGQYDKLCKIVEKELKEKEELESKLGITTSMLLELLAAEECYEKRNGRCYIMGFNKNEIILMPKWCPWGEAEFTRLFADRGKTWGFTEDELL